MSNTTTTVNLPDGTKVRRVGPHTANGGIDYGDRESVVGSEGVVTRGWMPWDTPQPDFAGDIRVEWLTGPEAGRGGSQILFTSVEVIDE
jgi:hypothetical protein